MVCLKEQKSGCSRWTVESASCNIMLNELDKELTRRGHRFVRYTDDCMILCKSRKRAERTLNNIVP
jgi:retron-type reverse transcriptase